ncbi:MAG: hypothetical protein ACE5HY_03645, partial [Candidatus Hydrothermarchaeales archaeon]
MILSNEMEEILEILWIRLEEEKSPSVSWKDISVDDTENLIEELEKDGHITLSRDAIKLTDKGRGEARDVIRR